MATAAQSHVRQLVVDWLDDNYLFGDTERLLNGDDGTSLLGAGLLDSLGFVRLVLHIEKTCGVRIDRTVLSPNNFGSIRAIVDYVCALPGYQSPP